MNKVLTSWQWIFVLVVLIIGAIFIPSDSVSYHKYDCYDKSVYKCRKCKKKCKWNIIVKRFEELEKENS
ncbi:hypothetical protein [Lacrimispora amygdalina]|uniref:hypothetical protein n=1 Tax=Lacrimispora amygdalina TaxID=253257 RepID=UPI000BE34752|nr:hypothetical protein [Lacrimispora amygdalina]